VKIDVESKAMDREYDIFECLRDGSVIWRTRLRGLESARLNLKELVISTGNDHFAMYLPTREVVFRVDASEATAHVRTSKRIFQIAYSEHLRNERAELLRRIGYRVISVIGNESARVLLSTIQLDLALFIVGHAASEQTRKEMVDWLKTKYPKVKVLALNPPDQQLPSADYNVTQNGPENWLPFVSTL
jgi:hypothetical protein